MDHLPEEIILHILSYLEPLDIACLQLVCLRLCHIGRDNELWKIICFDNSQHEALRRRDQAISDQEARLAALRDAINESMSPASTVVVNLDAHSAQCRLESKNKRQRAYSNWDPTYSNEDVDFYEEYIHRHVPISLHYFETAYDGPRGSEQERESLGIGAVSNTLDGDTEKLLAPLDDGSVCLWDAALNSASRGKIIARSPPHLLQGRASPRPGTLLRHVSTETGAIDNVSVDSDQRKAYLASENYLHEIDINTLQLVRRQPFPFPITALSGAKHPTPLTIGTNMTLHLHDPRVNHIHLSMGVSSRCELLNAGNRIAGGQPIVDIPLGHASLSQPGPLSILHLPRNYQTDNPSHAIWVAGRFKSLLHYDRRFWPQIAGTTFSGARLSSLTALPHPFVNPRLRGPSSDPNIARKAKLSSGVTVIAAGEYKGKGSLELYGVGNGAPKAYDLSSSDIPGGPASGTFHTQYQNRQYASKSRLLSVAPHGARIVFSDGDGLLKWVERDAWSVVRSFNINDAPAAASSSSNTPMPHRQQQQQHSLFAAQPSDDPNSDIVQKILPLAPPSSSSSSSNGQVNANDLAIWTGDGKLGLVAFGRKTMALHTFGGDGAAGRVGGGEDGGVEDEDEDEEEIDRERQRVYAGRMREALERQADEARWVRGLGLGF